MRYLLFIAALGLAGCSVQSVRAPTGQGAVTDAELEQYRRMPVYEAAGFGAPPVAERPNYVGPPLSGPPLPPPPQTESYAEREAPRPRNTSDADFVRFAYQASLAAIQAGKLAEERASAEVVKAYGKRLRKENEKIKRELERTARGKQIPLPATADAAEQSEIRRLAEADGNIFDRRFMEYTVKAQQELAATVNDSQAQDERIRELAASISRRAADRRRLAERIVSNEYGAGDLALAVLP